jgi:hypothetical protein
MVQSNVATESPAINNQANALIAARNRVFEVLSIPSIYTISD